MYGREILHRFWVFDNPDYPVIVGNEYGSLRFPFRVTHRRAATPAFLDAVGSARFGVFCRASLIANPAGLGSILLL
jgi:hypothetical protein